MPTISSLTCPKCGAPVSAKDQDCSHCGSGLLIVSPLTFSALSLLELKKYSSFYDKVADLKKETPNVLYAKGLCFLKLGLYEKAESCFIDVTNNDPTHSLAYFFQGISKFRGKRPRIQNIKTIQEVEGLIEAARELEPTNGLFIGILLFIKFDFYINNALREKPPTTKELLELSANYPALIPEYDEVLTFLHVKKE
jgi:tetratricopeptide (TPR) repeat protein